MQQCKLHEQLSARHPNLVLCMIAPLQSSFSLSGPKVSKQAPWDLLIRNNIKLGIWFRLAYACYHAKHLCSHGINVHSCYLTELFHSVGAKSDQARPPGTGLDPLHPIIGGGVTPKQIHKDHAAILHRDGPLQGIYLLYLSDGPADAYTADTLSVPLH